MDAKDQAEIYRNMARVFSGMDPRYQQLAQTQGPESSMSGFSYSSEQAAMWTTFSTLGRAFSVLADQYETAAKAAE